MPTPPQMPPSPQPEYQSSKDALNIFSSPLMAILDIQNIEIPDLSSEESVNSEIMATVQVIFSKLIQDIQRISTDQNTISTFTIEEQQQIAELAKKAFKGELSPSAHFLLQSIVLAYEMVLPYIENGEDLSEFLQALDLYYAPFTPISIELKILKTFLSSILPNEGYLAEGIREVLEESALSNLIREEELNEAALNEGDRPLIVAPARTVMPKGEEI